MTLLALCAYVFLEGLAGGLAYSTLAPFAKALGMNATEYGLATTLITIVDTLTTIFWGLAADVVGTRKLLIFGSLTYALAFVVVQAATLPAFFLACALVGVVVGMGPAIYAYVGKVAREKEKAFGALGASLTLGAALGGAIVFVFAPPYKDVFMTGSLVALLSAVVATKVKDVSIGKRRIRLKFERRLTPFVLYNAFSALGASAGIWLLDYYFVKKFQIGSAGIGSFVALNELSIAAGALMGPKLASFVGTLKAFVLTSGTGSLLTFLIAFAPSFNAALALASLRALFMNASSPLVQAMISKVAPEEVLGETFGVLNFVWSACASLGRTLGGVMMDVYVDMPILFSGLAYALATLVITVSAPEAGEIEEGLASRIRAGGKHR